MPPMHYYYHLRIGTIHTKAELRTMLELHVQHGAVDQDAGHVMEGALKFKDMTVHEIVSNYVYSRY